MLIKEYRFVMPISVDEYQVGQLFCVAESSKQETGGGEGVEILKNEPYDNEKGKGQYTHKRYHLSKKVPAYVRMLAPNGALVLNEEAWNGYPYCKTILTNEYMKDNFKIVLESMHLPDTGNTENALNCPADVLKKRSVEILDIADSTIIESKDYKEEEDPARFHSEKTGRGPLTKGEWVAKQQPVMTCYKLVTCEFKWFGVQNRVEQFIQKTNRNLLSKFHRQVFCYLDKWHGMTMADIRKIEEQTKHDLEAKIKTAEVVGSSEAD